MNKKSRPLLGLGLLVLFTSCQAPSTSDSALVPGEEAIHATMDAWHQAASEADSLTYFGSMASAESIFIGTDESERWNTIEFKAWSRKFFQRASAWTFVPVLGERHVAIRGDVAWLDEKLDSEHMGQCRGTGILVFDGDAQAWKIAHYTLSFAVPNEVADAVIDTIAHWNRSKLPK
jgi:hypothetical protein